MVMTPNTTRRRVVIALAALGRGIPFRGERDRIADELLGLAELCLGRLDPEDLLPVFLLGIAADDPAGKLRGAERRHREKADLEGLQLLLSLLEVLAEARGLS